MSGFHRFYVSERSCKCAGTSWAQKLMPAGGRSDAEDHAASAATQEVEAVGGPNGAEEQTAIKEAQEVEAAEARGGPQRMRGRGGPAAGARCSQRPGRSI